MKLYFELKTEGKKDKAGVIRAVIMDNKIRKAINTGVTATRKEWDKGGFKNLAAVANRKMVLDSYTAAFNQYVINCQLAQEAASIEGVKEHIYKALNREISGKTHLETLLAAFIEAKKPKLNANALKPYNTVIAHVLAFRPNTHLSEINSEWINKFVAYLSEQGLQNISVNKNLIKLKAFLKWAYLNRHTVNNYYERIELLETVKQRVVVLTQEELAQFAAYDFTTNPRLQRVQHLCLFAAYTGLRFKDFQQVNKTNIITKGNGQKMLVINTHKTGVELRLPLVPNAVAILEQYNYTLPLLSNQKLNVYIKEALRLAGIDTPVTVNYKTLNEQGSKVLPKWQAVSIHDFRKTFVTMYLESGLSVTETMALSTHTDYKSFQVYVALADQHLADKLNGVSFGKPSTLKRVV